MPIQITPRSTYHFQLSKAHRTQFSNPFTNNVGDGQDFPQVAQQVPFQSPAPVKTTKGSNSTAVSVRPNILDRPIAVNLRLQKQSAKGLAVHKAGVTPAPVRPGTEGPQPTARTLRPANQQEQAITRSKNIREAILSPTSNTPTAKPLIKKTETKPAVSGLAGVGVRPHTVREIPQALRTAAGRPRPLAESQPSVDPLASRKVELSQEQTRTRAVLTAFRRTPQQAARAGALLLDQIA